MGGSEMPGLHRDSRKHGDNKKRLLIDGAGYEPGPAAVAERPRAFQQPTVSPAPFVPRTKPEAPATADLPLWPGWHDDPTGRHESRYFDGTGWTDNVVDGARPSRDPFETVVDETPYGEFVPPVSLAPGEVATNGNGPKNTNGSENGNGHPAVTAGDLLFGKVPSEG
jgi:Protein of unknown function (DUF2510)